VTPKGQTRDPNTLRAHLEKKLEMLGLFSNNGLLLAVVRSAIRATAWLLVFYSDNFVVGDLCFDVLLSLQVMGAAFVRIMGLGS